MKRKEKKERKAERKAERKERRNERSESQLPNRNKDILGNFLTSEVLVEGITMSYNSLVSSMELFLENYGHFLGYPKV